MMNFEQYFSRQIALPEVGKEGQEKLSRSACLVVGAGGLGCAALYYLAAAGIGTLGICDADRLDLTNLHRQILYSSEDIGSLKAELAAKRLRKLNPFLKAQVYTERLTSANCETLIAQYDLILDCTDNFTTKYLLNDICYVNNKPLIRAAVKGFEGQLQCCFPNRDDCCLRCIWPTIPEEECVENCQEAGILGPLPGFFGVLQAMEALKFFLGLPLLNANCLLTYNLISHTQKIYQLKKNPCCTLCSDSSQFKSKFCESNWEITASSFDPAHFQLVDIREEHETVADPLLQFPCQHLPLSCFEENSLNPNQTYLFFCRSGKRSHNLVSKLRKKGWINTYSLIDGIQSLQNLTSIII